MAHPRFQLVPGSRLAASAGNSVVGGGVGWRLLGSNNRELGRSSIAYADAEAALSAIHRLRTLAASGDAHIVHDPASGHWAWHLDDEGSWIANSGRGFRHERECRYNLEQFRASAPSAPASEQDHLVDFPWQRSVSLASPSEISP
jgi:hypothetical protein